MGLAALGVALGLVAFTGAVLTGRLRGAAVTAYADFQVCGQGVREGGDVKERGVLVGRIGSIERIAGGVCRIRLDLRPAAVSQIPANSGAQIRAKTIFGEKWVELLYPEDPAPKTLREGDVIPVERTIDPLEIETILNVALPLLDAIDPERLAALLQALADGFSGHEQAAITGIRRGLEALRPLNRNAALVRRGAGHLRDAADAFAQVDEDLMSALDDLDAVNRFAVREQDLIEASLRKTPRLLAELSVLFESRFADLTRIADRGATVVGLLAARAGDVDRLVGVLPVFNSRWIRNLDHQCRFRQQTDEPGKSRGDPVPGRCWRVHNLISESRGPYAPGESPRPQERGPVTLAELLYAFEGRR